jgi:FAD/FMN-containing dehydrogenase
VWNGRKPNRFPAVIVVARTQQDVPRAVALARDEGLSIGIRSGGHNWVGNAVREGGLLLDLSQLNAIQVDPETRTALVEPGAHNDEVAAALRAHGLYFPVGHCSSVGMGGYLLGGGMGFNSDTVGPAAFSVRAIDMVTADGRTLHVTDSHHPDIMWAARGSGLGFFGAVTRFHLDLRPEPGAIAAAMQVHPLSAFDQLSPWYAECAQAPDGPRGIMIIGTNPALAQFDPVITVACYAFADDMQQATKQLSWMETAPGLDNARIHRVPTPITIEDYHVMFDDIYPKGLRYLSDNVWLKDAPDPKLWSEAKAIIESMPSPRSCIWLIPGMTDYRRPTAAFSLQTRLNFQVYAVYEDSAQDETILAWHNDAMARVDPFSVGGGYVGDSNLFERPVAILDLASATRLETLRHKYDPEGRFYSYPSGLPAARLAQQTVGG